jgi:predicted TIM-barrel fold metal-dependent hydrolase
MREDRFRPGRDFPIIDVHTHLFPPRLFAAVRRWFVESGSPIHYPTDPGEVAAALRARGVEQFWFFNYAHKPGMARELNRWNAETASRLTGAHALGTIHPADPDLIDIAREALDRHHLMGFKLHLDVQKFPVDDPRLEPFLDLVEERGCVLLVHGGTAGSHFDKRLLGVAPMRRVLTKHPRLLLVVAHMGAYEVDDFLDLTRRYARVFIDTCVCIRRGHPEPRGFFYRVDYDVDALSRARERVLFGSDFPNIGFSWEEEVDELLHLGLDSDFYRKIFHDNAAGLMKDLGRSIE